MQKDDFNRDLLSFLSQSPTPYHAVKQLSDALEKQGFLRLSESEQWQLSPGHRYYVTRNDSSLIAFIYGHDDITQHGIRMVGAHTDSPCLKVKPNPELKRQGYFQLGVETYGGVLLNPWFDRDLSLAGRISTINEKGQLSHRLIDFKRPIATIPSLAIHLDREANSKRSVNPQTDIPPVLGLCTDNATTDFSEILKAEANQESELPAVDRVLDYDLSFYDTQAPQFVGLNSEFLASARLDNLLSCFIGLQSLLDASGNQSCLLICNDHEEVGSRSACGAQGPMLADFLMRLLPDNEARIRCIQQSMMVSADNAHGIHPNFPTKHDANHGPLLNGGPVIKINANQSYATNSETSALFRWHAEQVEVPLQSFVVRTDMGCGSTIGPITAAEIGVKTLDIGVPTFGMHSIRETAGVDDAWSLYKVLAHFFTQSCNIDLNVG